MWGVMAVGGTRTVRSPSPQVACSHPSVGFRPLPEGLWGLGVYLGWQTTPSKARRTPELQAQHGRPLVLKLTACGQLQHDGRQYRQAEGAPGPHK